MALPGEMFQLYLENFNSGYYQCTFFLPDEADKEAMNKEIQEAADRNNVVIFMKKVSTVDTLKSEINIYANETAAKHLRKKAYVKANDYKSLFCG